MRHQARGAPLPSGREGTRTTSNRNHPDRPPPAQLGAALTQGALVLIALAVLATAGAQATPQFAGTFTLDTDSGPITLTLEQDHDLVTGALELGGNVYTLEGQVDDVGMYG